MKIIWIIETDCHESQDKKSRYLSKKTTFIKSHVEHKTSVLSESTIYCENLDSTPIFTMLTFTYQKKHFASIQINRFPLN